MLMRITFAAFLCSGKPPTGKQGRQKKKNQTASAPSDLPWVLKMHMQEHTKRVGKKHSHSHALLISTDMNYTSCAQINVSTTTFLFCFVLPESVWPHQREQR